MTRRTPKLTAARVRALLDCDPEAGTLTWKERPGDLRFNKRFAGERAGSLDPGTGYLRVRIDGKLYQLHRVLWLHVKGYWPPGDLDHRNGNKLDCAIGNLRTATEGENTRNCVRRPKPNGVPRGAWLDPKTGKFVVWINADRKRIFLGRFNSAEAAERAYKDAAADLHGEFAYANRGAAA